MEEVVAEEVDDEEEEEQESVAFRRRARFVSTKKEKKVSQLTRDENTAKLEYYKFAFYDYTDVNINFGIEVNEH